MDNNYAMTWTDGERHDVYVTTKLSTNRKESKLLKYVSCYYVDEDKNTSHEVVWEATLQTIQESSRPLRSYVKFSRGQHQTT